MKKATFIFLIILLSIITNTSCTKEDDNILVGTKWTALSPSYRIVYGWTCYDTFSFISNSEVEHYVTKDGQIIESKGKYSYALKYPHVTISTSSGSESYTFTDSRTMELDGGVSGMPLTKYLKQ